MSRKDIIEYDGESKPPFFEMTLKADKTATHHDLEFTVTLNGFDKSNNSFLLSRPRKAEIVGGKLYSTICLFIVTSSVVFSYRPSKCIGLS